MKKSFILMFLLSIVLYANSSKPLFAEVANIKKDSFLNIRSKPNISGEKLAQLPLAHKVGVNFCKLNGREEWCSIYPLVNNEFENFIVEDKKFWIHAAYLKFTNKGYVLVKNKPDCLYSIKCKNDKCEVVTDTIFDDNGNILELKTKWIDRNDLKGQSNFGVTPLDADGYCNIGMFIDEYLEKKNKK